MRKFLPPTSQNILELYNLLIQVRFAARNTELDIYMKV